MDEELTKTRRVLQSFLTKDGKARVPQHTFNYPSSHPSTFKHTLHVSKLNRNFRLFLLFPGKWRPARQPFLSPRGNNGIVFPVCGRKVPPRGPSAVSLPG